MAGNFDRTLLLHEQARKCELTGAVLDVVEALISVLHNPGVQIERLEILVQGLPHRFTLRGALGCAHGVAGKTEYERNVLHSLELSGPDSSGYYAYGMALTLIGLNEEQSAVA